MTKSQVKILGFILFIIMKLTKEARKGYNNTDYFNPSRGKKNVFLTLHIFVLLVMMTSSIFHC